MKKFLPWFVVILFVLGFIVRLYRFNGPIADWHAFRQSDTNAVSQIYVTDGINLLYPRFYDISNLASGLDNPHGYRYVEFPIYNALQAVLFTTFDHLTLVEWGRIITILATLGGAFFVYQLVRKYANESAGILSAGFYLFLPYSIYYGRTILPDPSMTAVILGGIYFFDKWIDVNSKLKVQNSKLKIKNQKCIIHNSSYFILATAFTALAFLLKPYALIFTLPMVYLVWDKFKFSLLKKWQLYLFAGLSLIPLVLWRLWISHHPEGIPASNWLFNGNGIRFHPAFFRWIFYERLTKLILGFAGIILFLDGILWVIKNKNWGFFAAFALSSLVYLTVIATGNVQHDYYQILIIPTVSIFAGLGTYGLYSTLKKFGKPLSIFVCAVLLILTFWFSWKQVKDYFNINDRDMVLAGETANKLLPKDAKVLASQDGSTTMLNLIQRPGWPLFEHDLPTLIKMGANYMVLADPSQSDINGFARNYKTVASTSAYLIIKLK